MPSVNGKILYVSRSTPPGGSGSAHVLKALLDADTEHRLLAVGGRPLLSRRRDGHDRLQRIGTELSLFGRGARFVAPIRELLRPIATAKLVAMARRQEIGRIVCVFPDAFYAEASLVAARRSGKPIDFWFHNTYSDNRSGLVRARALRLESRMLREAERLYFISDALMARYLEIDPAIVSKARVLHHPVQEAASGRTFARGFANDPVRATLIGNLNQSNIDAASRMIRALGGRDDLRIRIATPVPKVLLQARGMDLSGVDYLGYVAERDMPSLLDDSDLFLLPHGLTGGYSAQEYRTIFPTRAAYYLAHARPILAHCPEDSGLKLFLQEQACATCVSLPSERAIVDAFVALQRDRDEQQRMASAAAAASRLFDPARILRTLVAGEDTSSGR
jgi:glycosyltransferase involved in cell wall biosynthesis